LYAINTYSEVEESAMLRLALTGNVDGLIVAQGHMKEARVTLFEKPDDPKQLWIGHRLAEHLRLQYPHGLDHEGPIVYVGEHNGPASRIIRFEGATSEIVARGVDVLALKIQPDGRILSVGRDNITMWRQPLRK
jgi:hypothetical protein